MLIWPLSETDLSSNIRVRDIQRLEEQQFRPILAFLNSFLQIPVKYDKRIQICVVLVSSVSVIID